MNIITEWERQRRFAIVAELKDPAPAAIPRGWYRAPLASEKIAADRAPPQTAFAMETRLPPPHLWDRRAYCEDGNEQLKAYIFDLHKSGMTFKQIGQRLAITPFMPLPGLTGSGSTANTMRTRAAASVTASFDSAWSLNSPTTSLTKFGRQSVRPLRSRLYARRRSRRTSDLNSLSERSAALAIARRRPNWPLGKACPRPS